MSRNLQFCDCGETAIVAQSNLQNGKTKSCGCLNREQLIKSLGIVEGISIRQLEYYQRHLSIYNTSGYNGVYQDKKTGKWQAQISMDGKSKCLGRYASKRSAIMARQRADRQIAAFLDQHCEDYPEWKRPSDD